MTATKQTLVGGQRVGWRPAKGHNGGEPGTTGSWSRVTGQTSEDHTGLPTSVLHAEPTRVQEAATLCGRNGSHTEATHLRNSRPMHIHTCVLCILAASVPCVTKNKIRTRVRPRETRLGKRLLTERFRNAVLN